MSTKEDLQIFPIYKLENGKLIEIEPPECWNMYLIECHHFVKRQQYKRNSDKYMHIQKLIFLTPECHRDLHARNRNFKQKYGIEIEKLLYTER